MSSIASVVLAVDAILASIGGALLFFQPHLNRSTDGVHWHLVRCVGGQLLAASFVTWRLRKSATNTAFTVCHLLRIMPAILVLLLVFQCRSMTPHLISPQILEITKWLCFIGIGVNMLLLVFAGWPVGTTLAEGNTVGNCLYQLDALASICIGVAWLAFPNWLLHRQVIVTLDESHELMGRLMGALFVASYCVSTHALHWQSASDRNIAVDSRVVCCLCILSAQIWSQIAYGADWSGGHWVGITLFSTWTATAVVYKIINWFLGEEKKKKKKV